jgi:hypothetical protein
MIRSRAQSVILAVLCVVVLLPRLGGLHLHLCLDGSAPPVAFHVSDISGDELIPGTDEAHQDQTVDVSNPVLGKVWPPGLDGVLFLIVAVLLLISRGHLMLPALRASLVPRPPLFLRPPLRGPPA